MHVYEIVKLAIIITLLIPVYLMLLDTTIGCLLFAISCGSMLLLIIIGPTLIIRYVIHPIIFVAIAYPVVSFLGFGLVAFNTEKYSITKAIIVDFLILIVFIAITYPHFDEKVFTEKYIPYVTEESSDWL